MACCCPEGFREAFLEGTAFSMFSSTFLLFYAPVTDIFNTSAFNIDYNMYNYSCVVKSHSLVCWIPRMLNTRTGEILYAGNYIVCYRMLTH
jgi:hypothetical protein